MYLNNTLKKKTEDLSLFFIQKSDKWFQLKFISGSVNDRNKVGDISYSAYKKNDRGQ